MPTSTLASAQDSSRLSQQWRALGTYVHVGVRRPEQLPELTALTRDVLTQIDRTCSRFRSDSDLSRVNAAPGTWVEVDALLIAALQTALSAAEQTHGLVSPLLGRTLIAMGYDRTFAELRPVPGTASLHSVDPDAWRNVRFDDNRVRIPAGSSLDLGCTAKAFAADLVAGLAAQDGLAGIISIGGDLAVAAPDAGSPDPHELGFDVDISTHPDGPVETRVRLLSGGLATSSTRVRRWVAGDVTQHHLIDPRTGRAAVEHWHTVSAVGRSAVAANVATTAAVVLGQAAPQWLTEHGVSARLVDGEGRVLRTGDWPADALNSTTEEQAS